VARPSPSAASGTEAAAELRLDAERGEEVRGDAESESHLRGLAGSGKAHLRDAIRSDLAVIARPGSQIEVVGRSDLAT
jgi:hypothetical protein